MNNFPETFEVEHFNGKKGLLDKCRVDSNGAIFSKGDVNALEIGSSNATKWIHSTLKG